MNQDDLHIVAKVKARVEEILTPFQLDHTLQVEVVVWPFGLVVLTLFDSVGRDGVSHELLRHVVETAGFTAINEDGVLETEVNVGDVVVRQVIARFDWTKYARGTAMANLGVVFAGFDEDGDTLLD